MILSHVNYLAIESIFNKYALVQLYWNRTLAWVFFCKFAIYFQNTFYQEYLWVAASRMTFTWIKGLGKLEEKPKT